MVGLTKEQRNTANGTILRNIVTTDLETQAALLTLYLASNSTEFYPMFLGHLRMENFDSKAQKRSRLRFPSCQLLGHSSQLMIGW